MMSSGARRRRRQVVVPLLCTTLVPLALLLWLGAQFLAQDRLLEQNQRRDRAERSADLVIGALQRAIATSSTTYEIWAIENLRSLLRNSR